MRLQPVLQPPLRWLPAPTRPCCCPPGPAVHTLAELKLSGNHLKGSRPVLSFDANFDEQPHLQLLKEILTQVRRARWELAGAGAGSSGCRSWHWAGCGCKEVESGVGLQSSSQLSAEVGRGGGQGLDGRRGASSSVLPPVPRCLPRRGGTTRASPSLTTSSPSAWWTAGCGCATTRCGERRLHGRGGSQVQTRGSRAWWAQLLRGVKWAGGLPAG